MKQLSDTDIAEMISDEFSPDLLHDKTTRRAIGIRNLIPNKPATTPTHIILDLHTLTEEQSWNAIVDVLNSGARTATIITGASGILKQKFIQWTRDSVISPQIISSQPINNGSFYIKIRRHTNK